MLGGGRGGEGKEDPICTSLADLPSLLSNGLASPYGLLYMRYLLHAATCLSYSLNWGGNDVSNVMALQMQPPLTLSQN